MLRLFHPGAPGGFERADLLIANCRQPVMRTTNTPQVRLRAYNSCLVTKLALESSKRDEMCP